MRVAPAAPDVDDSMTRNEPVAGTWVEAARPRGLG
jgi:hypothetical protein